MLTTVALQARFREVALAPLLSLHNLSPRTSTYYWKLINIRLARSQEIQEADASILACLFATYNAEDCAALERVTDTVRALHELKTNSATTGEHDFVDVDSLKREKLYHFGKNDFALPALEQINKAGYWDYQRNRIFLRTDKRVKAAVQKTIKRQHHPVRINQDIELQDRPSCCPKCGNNKIYGHHWRTKIVHDLRFAKYGIKSWVVRCRSHAYICCSCHAIFYAHDKPWQWSKFGLNLQSYILYQIIELRMSQSSVCRSLQQLFGMKVSFRFRSSERVSSHW